MNPVPTTVGIKVDVLYSGFGSRESAGIGQEGQIIVAHFEKT